MIRTGRKRNNPGRSKFGKCGFSWSEVGGPTLTLPHEIPASVLTVIQVA